MSFLTRKLLDFKLHIIWKLNWLVFACINHLSKSSASLSQFLVITTATWIKLENLEKNFGKVISSTKSICIRKNLIPFYTSLLLAFSLWLVNWLILPSIFSSTNNQKADFMSFHIFGIYRKFHLCFSVVCFLFNSHNFDFSTLLWFSNIAINKSLLFLVFRSN